MAAKGKSFEEAIVRIENIVQLLESGEVSLDDSIKLYSEGIKLVGECNKKLDDTELKIKLLSLNSEGDTVESDFNK